ncbi:MAG: GH116 family glycosyl hydrolase [Candidatus Latescibacterota bacterium]
MNTVYLETEHQEVFAPNADLTRPVPVHIPSALARLGYYVCLRLPLALAGRVQQVRVHCQIGGLTPDDEHLVQGDGLEDLARRVPSRAPGMAWVFLCRAYLSRGEGTVSLTELPEDLARADLLLCTWPRFLLSGQADDWLACQADPHWARGGVPLGGIGTGKVELCRDGRFRNFSANNNQDMPFEEPCGLEGAYLAVGTHVPGGNQERVLATAPVDGLAPVPELQAEAGFPRMVLRADQALPGLDAEVTATAPLVPHDLRLSSLPGFLLRWRLYNRRADAMRATCRLAWPNLVGHGGGLGAPENRIGYGDGYYRYWEPPEAQTCEEVRDRGFAALRYRNAPSPVCPTADGCHYVAVAGLAGVVLHRDPRRGWVGRTVEIPAGGIAEVEMAVAWEMPHWVDSLGIERGHYWQNHCADGLAVLAMLFAQADRIWDETGALGRLLADTDLPSWLRARLQNCCYPLVTNSVLLRDGRFSVNEGPTEMAGCYGTLDQRLAAHPATLLFYPELNRRELQAFAACQSPGGGVNHDLGGGHLERGSAEVSWPDLTCAFVLQLARHAWLLGDAAFAAVHWPHARAAILRHARWAEAGGGVAQVGRDGVGTSYDGYHYEETTPYLGTLWIATLRVAAAWAECAGDLELTRAVAGWEQAALARLDQDLWNGRYLRTFGSPEGPTNDRCHAGMLAGEFFCRTLSGGSVLPAERLAACVEALAALNGSDRFAVPPDEVGPALDDPTEYGWLPYVEAFALTALALNRHPRVMAIWERMVRAMDGDGASPCDTRLMYQPGTGDPSWGAYYMTAPASWLVYEALLDFVYLPAEQVLRLHPQVESWVAVVHPLFWGLASQREGRISLRAVRTFGNPLPAVAQLEVPAATHRVRMDGRTLSRTETRPAYYRVALLTPVRLAPGVELDWVVE